MVKRKVPAFHLDPATRRAMQLDALAAILPMDRREPAGGAPHGRRRRDLKASRARRHGREQPAGARVGSRLFGGLNGHRRPAAAVAGDGGARVLIRDPSSLGSVEARERSPTWDARGRRRELASRGVAALRRPPAPNTVKRRLPRWSTCTVGKGSRGRSPRRVFSQPVIGRSRLAAAAPAQEQAGCHPGCPRSADATCATDRLADTRDLAIPLLAFASGGRRRSEVARLSVEQLGDEPPARLDPRDPKSPTLPCLAIWLGRTKTGDADEEGRVLLVGTPVEALRYGGARAGGVFRSRTARRISDRGSAARNRAAGGDAAVPASLGPAAREMRPSARRAGRQGWGCEDAVARRVLHGD